MADGYPGWLRGEQAELERQVNEERLGRVAKYLKDEIERLGIDDTGRLAKSIKVNAKLGTVVMRAPYGKFVEEGRAPGGKMPPYESIRRWVGHKLGIHERKKARNVTWAIMKKIKKHGIPGKWILEKAWKRALD